MPHRRPPRAQEWVSRWQELATLATTIAGRLPELDTLSRHTTDPDGYPTSSLQPGSKGGTSDPVGELVVNTDERIPFDLVAAWLDDLFNSSRKAWEIARHLERVLWLIDHRGDQQVGRQPSGSACAACDRYVSGSPNDRLRASFCPACYFAWRRWSAEQPDPSPVRYIIWRRQSLGQTDSRTG